MNNEQRRRVEELFQRALDLPAPERGAFLIRECLDDVPVRARVEALLRHSASDGAAKIDRPAFSVGSLSPSGLGGVPEQIGRYRILRLIGEGGMGAVYEAQQENPQRTVALKVVRSGLATRAVIKRFQQESRVLGRLNHPGIAQIYEAGVVDGAGRLIDVGRTLDEGGAGRPFFVMEFVHGIAIDQYAGAKNLGARERLSLVALVCDAVEHAHQQGVVHRDLKPGNILVDEVVGVARPRVLDFGVAHVADAEALLATLRTGVGELVGTLPYMSPEQAAGEAGALDARADVYSLGVLAFQMLTGRLPLDLSRRAIPEAARLIREEEPSKLGSINTVFRGDIETIVAKALEKDPARRYQSAGQMAADIRRFLHDKPIEARPAGAIYQFRKFARRNRGLVGGAAGIFGALLLGFVGMAYLAVRERAKTEESDRRAYRAGIAAAQAALEQNDVALARTSLHAQPEDRRGWEWRYLNHRADSAIAEFALPPFRIASITPDGSIIATEQGDGAIRLWNGTDGTPLRSVSIAPGKLMGMALSVDGERVLLTRPAGTAQMVDTRSGMIKWEAHDEGSDQTSAVPGDDGQFVALGASANRISLRDAATGRELRLINVSGGGPDPLFSPNGRLLGITGGPRDMAVIFDTATNALTEVGAGFAFLGFSSDGRLALVTRRAAPRGRIAIVECASGREVISKELPDKGVGYRGVFRPDGTAVAVCNRDRLIQVLDLRTLEPIAVIDAGIDLHRFIYTSDGSRLVGARKNGTVTSWDGMTPAMPTELPMNLSIRSATEFPDGRSIAVGDWGSVTKWDTQTGALLWMRCLSLLDVRALAVSADGQKVAADAGHGSVALLNAVDGSVLSRERIGRDHEIVSIAWLRNGEFATGLEDGTVEVRDAHNPGVVARTFGGAKSPVVQLALNSDESLLAGVEDSAWSGGSAAHRPVGGNRVAAVHIWHTATAAPPRTLAMVGGTPTCCAFGPNDMLAVGDDAGTVTRWNVRTGMQAAPPLRGAIGRVTRLAFSPDGARLAGAWADATIHYWDSTSGDEVVVLHAGGDKLLAFSSRDECLAAGGATLTLFETRRVESGLIRQRELHRQARAYVDPLLKEQFPLNYRLATHVLAHLSDPRDTPTDVLAAAGAFMRTRGDHAPTANSDAWGIVRRADATKEEYASALQLARAAASTLPDNASILNTLGIALFRTQAFDEAIDTLRHSDQKRLQEGLQEDPTNLAFIAMSLHRLARETEARQVLLRGRPSREFWKGHRSRDE